jgi:Fanconi anemia group J protein
VLVFFPSYSLLDRVAQRWKSTGAWRRLEQATGKKLFQEPRGAAEAEAAGEAKAGAAAGAEAAAARKTPSTRFCPSITARCG